MRALVFLVLQIKLIEAATMNNVRLLVPAAAAASDASGATGGLILEILRALKAHYHFFVVVHFLTCCTDRLAHGVYFHC